MKYKVGDFFTCDSTERSYIIFKIEGDNNNPILYLRDMKTNQCAPFYTSQLDGFHFYKHVPAGK